MISIAYRYETHMHTNLSSACGKSKGSEYIPAFKDLGYDGIFITDHFYLGNTCISRSLPWDQWVDAYCRSFEEAKEAGDKAGLKVFFGWETSYEGEDFLIYGLDRRWLKAHPEIITWNQAEQYRQIHAAGGLVVQAHPFRERDYQWEVKIHPHHCDAFEVANCGNLPYMDALAYEYARKHRILMTSGSDLHNASQYLPASQYALMTEQPLNSEQDYVRLIQSGTGFSFSAPENRFRESRMSPYFPVYIYDKKGTRRKRGFRPFPGVPVAPAP